MRLTVVAIGQKMPAWVVSGWQEYARRFPRGFSLELREVPAEKRGRNADLEAIRQRESQALLAAVPAGDRIVSLDENGRQWSTRELSGKLHDWMQLGGQVSFLVGGPEGLDAACIRQSQHHWSLGRLTLPHPLVRVVLAEQLYRAWTITRNHPYHRD